MISTTESSIQLKTRKSSLLLVFGGCGKKARKQGRILFQMSKWDM